MKTLALIRTDALAALFGIISERDEVMRQHLKLASNGFLAAWKDLEARSSAMDLKRAFVRVDISLIDSEENAKPESPDRTRKAKKAR